MGAALNLYLEQSTIDKFFEKDNSWKNSPLWTTLNNLQKEKKINVWISPQTVVELSIWSDDYKRHTSAYILENLIEGKRMLPSSEFIIIEELLDKIKLHWGNQNVNKNVFEETKIQNIITYSGVLAHAAIINNYDLKGPANYIRKTKLLSKLINLEIMLNPRENLEILLEGGDRLLNYQKEFNLKYESKSLEELKKIIEEHEYTIKNRKRDQAAAQLFERNREAISYKYFYQFVNESFTVVFRYFEEICSLLKYDEIVCRWDEKFPPAADLDVPDKLPEDVISRFANKTPEYSDYYTIIELLIKRYRKILIVPNIMINICLKENEKSLKINESSTEGMTIDLDHASMIYFSDIFFTYDSKLESSLNYWIKRINRNNARTKYCIDDLKRLRALFVE